MVNGIGASNNNNNETNINNVQPSVKTGSSPSLFFELNNNSNDIKKLEDERATDNNNIAELKMIVDNAEKFSIDSEMQRRYICFKDTGEPTAICAHREMGEDGSGTDDFYYVIFGKEYHNGEYGYDEIKKLFNKICDKIEN